MDANKRQAIFEKECLAKEMPFTFRVFSIALITPS